MLPGNCNEKNCPGWVPALVAGAAMFVFVMTGLVSDANADVRVEITRELPDERQIVIQQFPDEDLFSMWFTSKLEEGCDPYVSDIKIIRNYEPKEI
jgi:hypothetical protein